MSRLERMPKEVPPVDAMVCGTKKVPIRYRIREEVKFVEVLTFEQMLTARAESTTITLLLNSGVDFLGDFKVIGIMPESWGVQKVKLRPSPATSLAIGNALDLDLMWVEGASNARVVKQES